MVSTGQMMGYVMAILLPLIAVLIPFYILWKQSSKVERGMLGAIGYGIMGYFWQEIIYSFLGLLALTKMRDVLNATGGNAVVVAFVEALAGSVFVAAGLYWGVYLTNTKQRSLYRSTTVGLGFGLGAALLTYGFQLYYAIRINIRSIYRNGYGKSEYFIDIYRIVIFRRHPQHFSCACLHGCCLFGWKELLGKEETCRMAYANHCVCIYPVYRRYFKYVCTGTCR